MNTLRIMHFSEIKGMHWIEEFRVGKDGVTRIDRGFKGTVPGFNVFTEDEVFPTFVRDPNWEEL